MKFCCSNLFAAGTPFEQNLFIKINMDKMITFLNREIGQETSPHFPVQKPIKWTNETFKKALYCHRTGRLCS